jgi:ubiquinone/menaquinone biosynthesis C-methylase UbiE
MGERERPRDYDLIAPLYDETRGGQDRGRHQARILARFLDKNRPALDIGVGTGVVGAGLKEVGFQVVGVDRSREMLSRALPRLGGWVVQGNATRLPFPAAVFQQAYSVWVLHYVGDIAAALREVARVLRPGGLYLVLPQGGEQVSKPDPALQLIEQMRRRLMRPRGWAGNADDLRRLAPPSGLRVSGVQKVEPHSYEESPERLAWGIENRAYTYLADVGDETWHGIVEPTIAAIRALPDAHRPVKRWSQAPPMVILERA